MSKVVLITGATGKQGGAVVTALLASPEASKITILAVTRNAESASAKKLVEKGCKIVVGDLHDVPGVFESAKKITSEPIWGVFSIQIPLGKGASVETEEKQGKDLVDAALANNVQQFVYTSVDRGGDSKSYENPTPIPHFISKHNIEHHLVDKAGDKMKWTILRPVAFMDNATPDMMGKVFATTWSLAVKEKPLQLIASSDIGWFGAQAFINPSQYANKSLSLAGDSLSFAEASDVFESKVGYPLPKTFSFFGSALMWAIADVGKMFNWFYTDGYGADVKELKKTHPGLLSFGEWLEKESKFEMKK